MTHSHPSSEFKAEADCQKGLKYTGSVKPKQKQELFFLPEIETFREKHDPEQEAIKFQVKYVLLAYRPHQIFYSICFSCSFILPLWFFQLESW